MRSDVHGSKGAKKMRIKRAFVGLLAAAVMLAGIPAVSTPVMAAESATSATATQEVTVRKPSKVTVKSTAKKKAKVTIKKVSGATGYQVQYSTSKSFTSAKTKTTKKTSVTLKKLTSKKTYYVRVRAFVTNSDGSKTYSKWSTVKKVKVK